MSVAPCSTMAMQGQSSPCHVSATHILRTLKTLQMQSYSNSFNYSVTVTVTEALVLRPLLEDRGRITESIRILVPVDRIKQKCFQIRQSESVDRSNFSSIGSLFHARGVATEKSPSPIRHRVRSTTRLPCKVHPSSACIVTKRKHLVKEVQLSLSD